MTAAARRRSLAPALVIVVIAGAVVVWLLRGRDQRDDGRGSPPAPASVAAPSGPAAAPPRAPPPPGMRQVEAPGAPPVARLKRELEDYKKSSIYPHWSYPLTPDMSFLLRWNDAVTGDLPFDEAGTMVRFDGSAGRVFAGEPYTAWIEAWRTEGGKKRSVPLRVTRAVVEVTSGPASGEAFELTFKDDGASGDVQAGDFIQTTRFVPSERDELSRTTQARIVAYVELAGDARMFVRDFVFAPRPVLEVVALRDEVRDGSLVVHVDCDVLEAGVYTFYANLFASDGTTPIATTKLSFPLAAGRRTADLVFFGKVIQDAAIDGPYVVKDLHGLKREADDELDVWWNHPRSYQTAAYRADQLSDAEWDDPERTEKISNFERVIRELEQRGP